MIFHYQKSGPTSSRVGGLTLIELLIAIAIIVILVSIGVPVFKNFRPTLQLSGAARNLVTDLYYARQLAVTEQVDHGIYFSVAENKYQIIRYEAAATTSIKEIILPTEVTFQTVTSNEVKFNPYGAAAEEATTTLVNTDTKTKTIKVSVSGFVKILD